MCSDVNKMILNILDSLESQEFFSLYLSDENNALHVKYPNSALNLRLSHILGLSRSYHQLLHLEMITSYTRFLHTFSKHLLPFLPCMKKNFGGVKSNTDQSL